MDSFEPSGLRVFVYGTLMPGDRYHVSIVAAI